MKNIAEFVKDNYSEIIKNNPPLKDEELIKYIKSNDIKNIVHRDYIILHNVLNSINRINFIKDEL